MRRLRLQTQQSLTSFMVFFISSICFCRAATTSGPELFNCSLKLSSSWSFSVFCWLSWSFNRFSSCRLQHAKHHNTMTIAIHSLLAVQVGWLGLRIDSCIYQMNCQPVNTCIALASSVPSVRTLTAAKCVITRRIRWTNTWLNLSSEFITCW